MPGLTALKPARLVRLKTRENGPETAKSRRRELHTYPAPPRLFDKESNPPADASKTTSSIAGRSASVAIPQASTRRRPGPRSLSRGIHHAKRSGQETKSRAPGLTGTDAGMTRFAATVRAALVCGKDSRGVAVRIAIVSGDDFVGDDSGQLCAALAARGHHVTAYVRQRDRRTAGKSTNQDYRIVSMRVGPRAARSDRDVLPFVGDWAAELERSWLSDRPDIVHAHGWLGGLAAQLAARRQRLPTVQSFQGLAVMRNHSADGPHEDTERERIEPLLARNATWVTGESTVDVEALARLRHGRARLSVLTSGVDIELYTPVGPMLAHDDLHHVLCPAPNSLPCNGFDVVIRALPKVPGTELVVAETAATDHSHDEARAELKRLATELGVADRVRLMCAVVGDDLPMLLRSADVVACTPRQPPRATTMLQAMASGVAVVALPVGVLIDAVVHGVTGLVLSPSKPGELVGALRSLQARRFQRESMGAAGRSHALSRFTWDRIALESLTIYRQLSSPYLPAGGAAAFGSTVTAMGEACG
jgi:glycosyltransferase involved in cell wall biosynthesis